MTLRSVLGASVGFNAPALPDLKILEARKERILSRWPDVVATPPEKDRERLVQEMRRRLEDEQWDETPMSLVTSAARALFDLQRRERPDLAGLRQFYYDEIGASTRRSFLDAMLSVYLVSYKPGTTHTRSLASALDSAWSRIGARWRQLRENIPELLDPDRAPKAVAAKMRGMEDCWRGLQALGLRTPHAPGLMDHAHLAFVQLMRPSLNRRVALEQLFGWLKPEGQQARMSGAAEAITAVLEPWLSQEPRPDEITFITETLQGLYGDPRVHGGGAWAGVPPGHLAVLMRWLTGENIRFFLDVVSAVEENHMWEPRRRFWLSLHEQKRIDAAWVAFSDSGVRHATRLLNTRSSRNTLGFGRQTAGGSRVDTSLLILKIGRKIVVEGSHSYKVHIFKESDLRAPKLYRQTYDCEAIRLIGGAEARSHIGDWQGWVRERI
jgi:hypothetical protein